MTKKILIIDADYGRSSTMADLLRNRDREVFTAATQEQVISRTKGNIFNIIILDPLMSSAALIHDPKRSEDFETGWVGREILLDLERGAFSSYSKQPKILLLSKIDHIILTQTGFSPDIPYLPKPQLAPAIVQAVESL
ncbi:MAG: hypothetical protein KBC98_02430 [Candidatus Pacebacteria bacterium]|nr:hypothetical protein [Candidatus Paceibacterota bacterium]